MRISKIIFRPIRTQLREPQPTEKLEDLKVLKRSPDLLNNVEIGQGQLRLIIQTYFVLPYMGSGHFDQVSPKNNIIFKLFYLLNTPNWVRTAQWILRKRCLDMYKAVPIWVALDERSKVSLTFGAYIKPVSQ